MRIKAFNALRPRQDNVHLVACPPYDTVSEAEARELVRGNPWSFLHVVRPEVDLAEGADPHSDEAYARAASNLAAMIEAGKLEPEGADSLYVYRQTMGTHSQSGIVACCHVDDYTLNVIRQHERTRADKEDDRVRHVDALSAHSGPAFLAYRRSTKIDRLMAEAERDDPILHLQAPDGVLHCVWRVREPHALVDAFHAVHIAYIADGHHRSAAAVRVAQKRRVAGADGALESDWFLSVLFPAEDLQILPYNRCVRDLNGLAEAEFLVRVRERFRVTEDVEPKPHRAHRVSMYLAGRWFGLSWDTTPETDRVSQLDVSYLQDNLLSPVLGIADPRTSSRIDFVGGILGTEALMRRVDGGDMAVAFSMYPVAVEQMMAISDVGAIMPPKSTWFEPKLRSGLLVHSF